ncbi:metallophosphoesterase [Litoribacter populi]|uniref:metallophosphoesterase n=1 Tax=Litoribacter populi TaxID=2598460 RepID=UPI00117F6A0D|nr:metallophosphoesterase [Litoribacter populi]
MKKLLLIYIALLKISLLQAEEEKLRLVVLPDTQSYLESCPEIMESQLDWLAENHENIDYVLHVGDITQGNTPAEWALSQIYFKKINGKIPYALSLGNHDMGSGPNKFADTRDSSLANKYFPLDKLKSNSGLQGAFEEDKIDNTYHTFEALGRKWLILSLEFGPRNKVLDWANQIVHKHFDHLAILITHAYMYIDGQRQSEDHDWRAHGYGVGSGEGPEAVNDGDQIWDKLVKRHPNFFMVYSGHVLHDGHGQLISEGEHGNEVYQYLANYQRGVKGFGEGCNGFLRIVDITPTKIETKTYSPWKDEWLEDSNNKFFNSIDLNRLQTAEKIVK